MDGYKGKLKDYLREKNALEEVTIRKMRTLSFDQFDHLLCGVTSRSKLARLRIAMRHLDMFYVTMKWFGTKKEIPDWPV